MTDVARCSTLTGDQRHDVAQLLDAALVADGVAALSEQSVLALAHSAPGVDHFVVVDASTGVVGYGNVLTGRDGESPMAEVVVAPTSRRRGHGVALVTAILDAYPQARLWAHGDLSAARAVAAAAGLSATRTLLQLRRPLGGADLPAMPHRDDIILRTYAGVEDDAEILRVNNAAFDWHPEQGGWTLADIAERTGSDWFDEAGLFLAFDNSAPGAQRADGSAPSADSHRLLGFHWTKIHGADLGEVYIVGVDATAQGRGLGRHLTLAGLHYLNSRVAQCTLYVEGDNTAALHTYRRLGFEQYAIDVAYGRRPGPH